MLKVVAYTGGHNAPARVPRVQHYISYLKGLGIELTECPSRSGSFPPKRVWMRSPWGVWNLVEHFPKSLRSYNYDVTLLQREMLSTLVTFEPLTKRPRVLDVDDAIWVHRGGRFAQRLARICDHVICGNSFLAQQFSLWNPSVSILPTSVDTVRFVPAHEGQSRMPSVIGWFGLSAGFRLLYTIEPALAELLRRRPDVVLHVVSDNPPKFKNLPPGQVKFVPYKREQEVAQIQNMDIGIMPLDDSAVSRGKCSFKMLQYMACGIPVVVSRFGMNAEILQEGEMGCGAVDLRDWVLSLEMLLRRPDVAKRMGKIGRAVVERNYSAEVLAPRLAKTLFAVGKRHRLRSVSVNREMF